jgi:hypothetical protein
VYTVEAYARVRRAVQVDGLSERAAAREFGISRDNGSQDAAVFDSARLQPAAAVSAAEAGRLDRGSSIRSLEEDKTGPGKQRHSAKRIFERLRESMRFRRLHDRDRLRAAAEAESAGDAPAAGASCGSRTSGVR